VIPDLLFVPVILRQAVAASGRQDLVTGNSVSENTSFRQFVKKRGPKIWPLEEVLSYDHTSGRPHPPFGGSAYSYFQMLTILLPVDVTINGSK
jgi:hypothetical protein